MTPTKLTFGTFATTRCPAVWVSPQVVGLSSLNQTSSSVGFSALMRNRCWQQRAHVIRHRNQMDDSRSEKASIGFAIRHTHNSRQHATKSENLRHAFALHTLTLATIRPTSPSRNFYARIYRGILRTAILTTPRTIVKAHLITSAM